MTDTLVIHPGALGDVLLALPALRALRSRHPADTLRLAAQPRIGQLLTALGVVDQPLPFDSLGLHALFADGPLPEPSAMLARATRVVSWFGARDGAFVRRLRAVAPGAIIALPAPTEGTPVWEHLLRTVTEGTLEPPWLAPVTLPKALMEDARHRLRAEGWDGASRLVIVHPGAGGAEKRWPVEGFERVLAHLAERERCTLVLHEGPADAEAVRALASRRPDALRLVEPPLPLLAGALGHAAIYVGNDSGISHLAAAVGVPSVVLFTEAALGWRPWASTARPLVVATGKLEAPDLARVLGAIDEFLKQPHSFPLLGASG
jgi:ADP-heptose:LPS heptosyltransferase